MSAKLVIDCLNLAGVAVNDDPKKVKKLQLEKLKKTVRVVAGEPVEGAKAAPRKWGPNTILIKDLAPGLTKHVVYKKVRKFGTVKELIMATSENGMELNTCKATYSKHEEAKDAVAHLDNHVYKGATIKCQLINTVTEASLAKKARLIIRNLSFKCQKSHLKKVFEVYGELVDFQVPLMPDGKARGLGFVQFKNLEDAKNAVEGVNGKDILGRPVAVDWALGKAEYDRLKEQEEDEDESESEETAVETPEPNGDEDDGLDEEAIILAKNDVNLSDSDDDEDTEQIKTLFVRNLGFETTKATLKDA